MDEKRRSWPSWRARVTAGTTIVTFGVGVPTLSEAYEDGPLNGEAMRGVNFHRTLVTQTSTGTTGYGFADHPIPHRQQVPNQPVLILVGG